MRTEQCKVETQTADPIPMSNNFDKMHHCLCSSIQFCVSVQITNKEMRCDNSPSRLPFPWRQIIISYCALTLNRFTNSIWQILGYGIELLLCVHFIEGSNGKPYRLNKWQNENNEKLQSNRGYFGPTKNEIWHACTGS